jgi:sec-independent protein translocase protein TatA
MFGLGAPEVLLLLFIGLLLFGKRLPDLARSVGRTFVEVRKGVQSVDDELQSAAR